MYARITTDLKEPLETRVRRMRFISSLKHFPACVAIFSAGTVLLLFTKGHGLVRLIIEALDGRFTEVEVVSGIVGLVVIAVSAGLIYVSRDMIRAPLFEEHYFCGACNAVDKDGDAVCPFCNQTLTSKATFFYTFYDDEVQLADRFGLTGSREI